MQLLDKGVQLCAALELFDVVTVFVVRKKNFSVFNPRRVMGEALSLVRFLGHGF